MHLDLIKAFKTLCVFILFLTALEWPSIYGDKTINWYSSPIITENYFVSTGWNVWTLYLMNQTIKIQQISSFKIQCSGWNVWTLYSMNQPIKIQLKFPKPTNKKILPENLGSSVINTKQSNASPPPLEWRRLWRKLEVSNSRQKQF